MTTRFSVGQFLVGLTFMAALLLLLACNDSYIYKETKEINGDGWMYRDTLDFAFEITDTGTLYNLYLNLEAADTFSSQNIYLKLHTRFPDGRRVALVKSFDLYDAAGVPQGDCSGQRCKYHILLQERAFFNTPGTYTITVGSHMRFEPLKSVYKVGLSVENTKQKK